MTHLAGMKGGTVSAKPNLSPLAKSFVLAPFGLLVIAWGVSVGVSGRLVGRSGGELELGDTWKWIVGGFFIGLGIAIAASPLIYLRPRKPDEPNGPAKGGV